MEVAYTLAKIQLLIVIFNIRSPDFVKADKRIIEIRFTIWGVV